MKGRALKLPPAITPELAAKAFDRLWEAFDRDYAMFVLRPEVDWNKSREQFRPRALASKSVYEFADVCAEMLKPLRDLHVWLKIAGTDVPVFDRPRPGTPIHPRTAPCWAELRRQGPRAMGGDV